MPNFRGREPGSHVWEWTDDQGHTVYVGHGPIGHADGSMPWERLWNHRERVQGTLGKWLASLSGKPWCSWVYLPSVPLDRSTAAGVAALRRKALRRLGVQLLATRNYGGSGPMRSVTIAGIKYRSLRAAAIATNTPWATFWRRLGGRPAA
jgi:hypothetical protein